MILSIKTKSKNDWIIFGILQNIKLSYRNQGIALTITLCRMHLFQIPPFLNFMVNKLLCVPDKISKYWPKRYHEIKPFQGISHNIKLDVYEFKICNASFWITIGRTKQKIPESQSWTKNPILWRRSWFTIYYRITNH